MAVAILLVTLSDSRLRWLGPLTFSTLRRFLIFVLLFWPLHGFSDEEATDASLEIEVFRLLNVRCRELNCACTTTECISAGADICRAPRHCYSRWKSFTKSTEPLEKGCVMEAALEQQCARMANVPATVSDSSGIFVFCCSRSWCNSNALENLPTLSAQPAIETIRQDASRLPLTSPPTSIFALTTQPPTAPIETVTATFPALPTALVSATTAATEKGVSLSGGRLLRHRPVVRAASHLDITVAAPALAACLTFLAVVTSILVFLLLLRCRRGRQPPLSSHLQCRLEAVLNALPPPSSSPEQILRHQHAQYDLHYQNILAEQRCSPMALDRSGCQTIVCGLGVAPDIVHLDPALLHQDD